MADTPGKSRHLVLPVIPVETCRQAVRNAAIARTAGSDGVFLINHGVDHRELLDIAAAMKKAMGDFPLAIASGIMPENVATYLPVADCFLVATGISRTWSELDPFRVRDLVQIVRSERNARD